MPPVVNIAAYKFAELTGLVELRVELRELAKCQKLRGTILLSPEGINLFVAGLRDGVDALLERVRRIPGAADLDVKESISEVQPFNRMLVKIKSEIIAFGVPGIDPRRYTSRRLPPGELKRWLDEGRPVTLLDTRNDFEVKAGTFKNAVAIGVDDFRAFPAAVSRLPEERKRQPVVTFCTGGIRCEKAAPFLEREGFSDVYQLDGGILKYFEECGGAHYDGHCFVFDKRVALDPALKEAGVGQCFACQAVLSPDELASPKYVEGQSCPRCHRSPDEQYNDLIRRRRDAIRHATCPLPGSIPYDNERPINVPLRFDGLELLDFLDAMHTHLPRDAWRQACVEGRLVCRGEAVQPGRIMRAGEVVVHTMPATREPDVATGIEIVYEDDAIVVVNKPAPLPMHPCGRFNRNSLSYILNQVYAPLYLRPAHRLDADTSGVVVFAKTRAIARLLQQQFESGTVRKTYLARVYGCPAQAAFECHAPISPDPGRSGVRLPSDDGVPASTRFCVLRTFDDGTSLLEITPLTGRTNQIRVHLWSLLLPIVGDPIYLRNQQLGPSQTLSLTDQQLCLQATAIEFSHPLSGAYSRHEASPSAVMTSGGEGYTDRD